MSFEYLNNKHIRDALLKLNITEPTTIQSTTYKAISEGKNVIGKSQTGSGKTYAYLLPILEKIDSSSKELYSIILVPTYELAIQVNKEIEKIAKNSNINFRHCAIIGNGNINRQIEALKSKPHIVVGTAGRIYELIKKKKISAHTVKTLIIDEADKMVDKNNIASLLDVRKCCMKNIQILAFSASFNNKALTQIKDIAQDACIFENKATETMPELVEHYFVISSKNDKIETLRSICSALKPNKAIIFINKQYDSNQVYEKLNYHHYKVVNLCGNVDKNNRKTAMERIISGKANYLISTDIASRGLHIDNVDVVINVNVPAESKDYLHRAGRCGRNNNKGICISIVTENELSKLLDYQKSLNIKISGKKLYKGKLE